jgi:hypothetical protein
VADDRRNSDVVGRARQRTILRQDNRGGTSIWFMNGTTVAPTGAGRGLSFGDMGFELCHLPDMPAVLRALTGAENSIERWW